MITVFSSVAAVVSCYCFIIVAAVIVLWLGALFLLFVLLYSQRVANNSCETEPVTRAAALLAIFKVVKLL